MIPFVKAHAYGNDFLIVEESLAGRRHVSLARQLCARQTSVGADGIEFLDRRADGQLALRLFNSDGNEAELSGNGTRCVAAWLASSEGLTHVSFATHAGERACRVLSSSGNLHEVESSMGVPRIMPRTIELPGIGNVEGAMVNMGNPHFVVLVNTTDFGSSGLAWQDLGQRICTSPLFSNGTNVEFVCISSPEQMELRIYERGCGPTSSSGTGTCAAATAGIALHGMKRELTAVAEGGSQHVVWQGSNQQMLLTGAAEMICTGEAFA